VPVCLQVDANRNRVTGLGVRGCGRADDSAGYLGPTGAGIHLEGGRNTVEACQFTQNGYGIRIGSNHNTIVGNTVEANDASGIRIYGDDNAIGGASPGEGNLISGNGRHGIDILVSEGNLVLGNSIGVGSGGAGAFPNAMDGIAIQGGATIGGLAVGEGNTIMGNGRHGIVFRDTAMSTLVAGNAIYENVGYGIYLEYAELEGCTFTRNSIYNNAELGIEIRRVDDHVPVLEPATLARVEGTACGGCQVEIFLAAPDPTGFGEGMTYLGEATADIAGRFSLPLSGLDNCDELTATATDGAGDTSEFSENVLVQCLSLPGFPMVVAGLVGEAASGLVLVVVRRFWPQVPPWSVPVGPVFGLGSVGILLAVAVLHPSMDVEMGSRTRPAASPDLPSCAEFVDVGGSAPADDASFALDEDPEFVWMPQGRLPAQEWRWRLDLRAPDQKVRSQTTEGVTLPFSDFGFEPRPGGRYNWRASAEALQHRPRRWG
jgi:parallel beta-helix repeat protein